MKNLKLIFITLLGIATIGFTSCVDGGGFGCLNGDGIIESRTVDFNEVEGFELSGSMNLRITEGESQEIIIESYPNIIDDLIDGSSVNNGILDLKFGSRCVSFEEDVEIYATVAALRKIEVSGSSKVRTNGIFQNVDDLELKVSGSADMKLELGDNMDEVKIELSGTGDFDLSGAAEFQDIEISGSGNVGNFELITQDAKIEINGSGDCEIQVENTLDIKISGSGDVCYRGNASVTSDISGSGNIRNCN